MAPYHLSANQLDDQPIGAGEESPLASGVKLSAPDSRNKAYRPNFAQLTFVAVRDQILEALEEQLGAGARSVFFELASSGSLELDPQRASIGNVQRVRKSEPMTLPELTLATDLDLSELCSVLKSLMTECRRCLL